MNILITGASGLLGRSVMHQLKSNPAWQVYGTAFSRAQEPLLPLDLNDSAQVRDTLESVRPSFVIHCAAERWPDRCAQQPDAAWQLNVRSTEQLARLCTQVGAQLVYISTDYVFDGNDAPYDENATPNPVNFYGRSKLAGEKAVLANGNHWVLRIPLLFGPVSELRESGVTALLETLRNPAAAALDHWAIRYPTSTEDIARVLEQCLQLSNRGTMSRDTESVESIGGVEFSGIYHWSSDHRCTRYQLAQLIAEVTGMDSAHIRADTAPQFDEPRPYNCQLDKSRLRNLGIAVGEPLSQQLARYLQPFL